MAETEATLEAMKKHVDVSDEKLKDTGRPMFGVLFCEGGYTLANSPAWPGDLETATELIRQCFYKENIKKPMTPRPRPPLVEADTAFNILTPFKPEWKLFTDKLTYHLDIIEDEEESLHCTCDGTFKLCKNIITNCFPDIDIEPTLGYFRANNWYCDCDVFFESPSYLGDPP